MNNKRLIVLLSLVVLGIATRLFPHMPNFTAVGATALMAGALFKDWKKALFIPLIILFLSDLILNNIIYSEYAEGFQWFTEGFIWIYLGFVANVLIGRGLANGYRILPLAMASICGAIAFYLFSNIGSWLALPMYTKDLSGLIAAYVAGLPFLANQVLANLSYGVMLFGIAYLFERQLKLNTISA